MIPCVKILPADLDVELKKTDTTVHVDYHYRGVGSLFITEHDLRWVSSQGDPILIRYDEIMGYRTCHKVLTAIIIDVLINKDNPGVGLVCPEEPDIDRYTVRIEFPTQDDTDEAYDNIDRLVIAQIPLPPDDDYEYDDEESDHDDNSQSDRDRDDDSQSDRDRDDDSQSDNDHDENHDDSENADGENELDFNDPEDDWEGDGDFDAMEQNEDEEIESDDSSSFN